MSSYLRITELTQATADGKAIEILSESFAAQAQAVVAEIQAIEAERPWGNDHFGEAFEATYMGTEDATPARQFVLESLEMAGDRLEHLGGVTVSGTRDIALGQAQNAAALRAADPDR